MHIDACQTALREASASILRAAQCENIAETHNTNLDILFEHPMTPQQMEDWAAAAEKLDLAATAAMLTAEKFQNLGHHDIAAQGRDIFHRCSSMAAAIQMRLDKIAPESLAPGEEGRP